MFNFRECSLAAMIGGGIALLIGKSTANVKGRLVPWDLYLTEMHFGGLINFLIGAAIGIAAILLVKSVLNRGSSHD